MSDDLDTRSDEERAVGIDCGKASAEELRAKAAMWSAIARAIAAGANLVETAITEALKR